MTTVLPSVGREASDVRVADASATDSLATDSLTTSCLATDNLTGSSGSGTNSLLNEQRALLTLRDVSVRYPYSDAPSVQQVNLTVHDGECVLFLGPSGCGKSTLALACADLIPSAIEGEVTGELLRDEALKAPGAIAVVFQDPETQFCMLQVDDELAFGMENRLVSPSEMRPKMEDALRKTGLQVPLNGKHVNFSGGMKQKLAIASSLVVDNQLLILDEPTANLDPLATGMVFDTVARLRRQGRTMIIIEHKFDALLPVVDTVVLFTRSGRVHRVGPPRDVVAEEWAWMISEGIVSPWKAIPESLHGHDAQSYTALFPSHSQSSATCEMAPAHDPLTNQFHADPRQDDGDPRSDDGDLGSDDADPRNDDVAPRQDDVAIRVRGGSLKYGKNAPVWDDVSLDIAQGALVAVVGPNGAGKSSLLQVLTGLQPLSAGEVQLFGKPLSSVKLAERFRRVSYCFQNPEYQFVFERVGDELANRVVGENVPGEVIEGLAQFGLESCVEQSPYSLSQGQKRRLSVAAMLRDPHDLYVLDEPTFGQDAHTQHVIMEKLYELHKAGKTIVMSTHDMDLVSRFATHVLVLAEGKLAFSGHPDELLRQPKLMARAHLFDDLSLELDVNTATSHDRDDETTQVSVSGTVQLGHTNSANDNSANDNNAHKANSDNNIYNTKDNGHIGMIPDEGQSRRRTPASMLNPGLNLVTAVAATVVSIFASTLSAAGMLLCLPLVLLLGLAWLSPWKIIKRFSPFLVFYLFYTLSFVLFSSVQPGAAHVHLLWWNVSWIGLRNGGVLAFRMLAVVGFGILVVSVTDITALIVSLSQNFRLQPRFAYGVLAGIRFAPMFQAEWHKLRQARTIRGKDARWAALRPVTYALPLLAQAIRMSERVAVAMEARGFTGSPALQWNGRSRYRDVPVRSYDIVYSLFVVCASTVIVWVGNHL